MRRRGNPERAVAAALILGALTGCSVPQLERRSLPAYPYPKARAVVRLQPGPGLPDYRHLVPVWPANPGYLRNIGQASAWMFEDALRAAFESVVVLARDEPPPVTGAQPAAIVRPEIVSVFASPSERVVELWYQVSILSPDGEAITAWRVPGLAEVPAWIWHDPWAPAMEAAVRDAARRFLADLHSVPSVVAWMEQLRKRRPPPD